MENEGLKLLSAEITNFKNITHKEVEFDGKSAIIIGPNGAGKSSLLQAIQSPVNSKIIPEKPIKDGEERSSVEITIGGPLFGEEVKYNIGCYFSEQHQKGRLKITNENGEDVTGGKNLIKEIVGNISFDMMEFLNLSRTKDGNISKPGIRQQIEILRSLLPQEANDELSDIDNKIKTAKADKNDLANDIKRAEAKLTDHGFSQEEIEKYSNPKDPKPVMDKISKISEEIERYNKAINYKIEAEDAIPTLEKEIERLTKMLNGYKSGLEKTNAWLEKNGEKPSVENLTAELTAIENHNSKHREVKELEDKRKEIEEAKGFLEDKKKELSDFEKQKKSLFAKNPLPVQGLEFDEEQILYKGLPLHSEQIPTSTQIAIGVKIGMAMNPNLKLIIIRDGSLLDSKTREFILKICDKKGYQVLIEMVDDSAEGALTIDFVERNLNKDE